MKGASDLFLHTAYSPLGLDAMTVPNRHSPSRGKVRCISQIFNDDPTPGSRCFNVASVTQYNILGKRKRCCPHPATLRCSIMEEICLLGGMLSYQTYSGILSLIQVRVLATK